MFGLIELSYIVLKEKVMFFWPIFQVIEENQKQPFDSKVMWLIYVFIFNKLTWTQY